MTELRGEEMPLYGLQVKEEAASQDDMDKLLASFD